jgi:hypothetical protein
LKKQLITIIDYQHVPHNSKEELKRVMHYTIKYIKNPEMKEYREKNIDKMINEIVLNS